MRLAVAVAVVILTTMSFLTPAVAGEATEPNGGATKEQASERTGIGAEAQVVAPVSGLSDRVAPMLGPVLRLGYFVTAPLELTIRSGFLVGLMKDTRTSRIGADLIPIQIGARYFFIDAPAGPFVGGEVGINVILRKYANPIHAAHYSGKPWVSLAGNVSVGYVVSKTVPIDIRAQLMLLSVIDEDQSTDIADAVRTRISLALGASAGYTFQF